ncbi:MAG TPA: hypothetical protein VFY82_06590 [Acidimicrobiales bacterium]|nr:hypothetical protein [Acidimicrobiales bacterium]
MIDRRAAGVALALAIAIVGACASEADEQTLRAALADRTPTEDATAADDDRPTPPDPVTTTTDPPTTTTTAPPPPGFDGGTRVVGTDMQPGRYISEGQFCYWERLSGLTGAFEDIIVNGNADGQAIVEIVPGDVAFNSNGCGRWSLYQPPPAPVSEFGSGDWVVGEQIVPGTYRAEGEFCYWERASGFAHDFDEILANGVPEGQAVVEILASDTRFTATGCGPWTPA